MQFRLPRIQTSSSTTSRPLVLWMNGLTYSKVGKSRKKSKNSITTTDNSLGATSKYLRYVGCWIKRILDNPNGDEKSSQLALRSSLHLDTFREKLGTLLMK